jgi:universal stress protein E
MSQFNSILIVIGKSGPNTRMLDKAIGLAKKHQAAVKIFHVISDYPEDTSEWWNVRDPAKLKKQVIAERQAVLDEMVTHARELGLDQVSSELRWGGTFLEISREVMKHKHDLTMVTVGYKQKIARKVLECPSMDLLQHCPCTLWLSRGTTQEHPRRVLAALGGMRDEIACDALDIKILHTAAAIAEANGSELHYVHAMPLYGGEGQKGKKLRSDLADNIDRLKSSFMQKCGNVLREYQVKLNDDWVHMVAGSPANVIVNLVDDKHIDLVVMGARTHDNMPTVLLGTRAMQVFDYVKCDVVGVKPDDFVSLLEREGVGATDSQDV